MKKRIFYTLKSKTFNHRLFPCPIKTLKNSDITVHDKNRRPQRIGNNEDGTFT